VTGVQTCALPILAELERTTDALRVTLSEGSRISERSLAGGVYVDLPNWRREEWAEVAVRARTIGSVNSMFIGLNPADGGPRTHPRADSEWEGTLRHPPIFALRIKV